MTEYWTLAGRFQDLAVESRSGEIAFCNFESPSGVTFYHYNLPIRLFATLLGIHLSQCSQLEQYSPLCGPLVRISIAARLPQNLHFAVMMEELRKLLENPSS